MTPGLYRFRKGRVEAVGPDEPLRDDFRILTPGFVDLHIHGGFGIDVMSASSEDLRVLDEKLRGCGYEGWLATTVTCAPGDALRVLEALPPERETGILGLHLEGPFISPRHPGAQPPPFIVEYTGRGTDWDAVLDHPRLRLVTLAPEIPGGLELTRRLVERGVIVSLGHSDATYDQTRVAYAAGARHVTHTFNAMRPLHHREAGLVGAALVDEDLNAEIIYDRLHVGEPAARLFFANVPMGRQLAVSDGTMATGLSRGTRLEMWGLDCVVGDGEVRLVEGGGLAGSAITLLDAFRNIARDHGWAFAVAACSIAPRAALGLGPPKTWLAFSPGLEAFEILRYAPPR